jgi:hypothetical protein
MVSKLTVSPTNVKTVANIGHYIPSMLKPPVSKKSIYTLTQAICVLSEGVGKLSPLLAG